MQKILRNLLVAAATASAHVISRQASAESEVQGSPLLEARAPCTNGPTSRGCWGEYSIDTNHYTTIPSTGKTVEYWLTASEIDCAPDGYKRRCQAFNGTIPGPLISADWGDVLKVHVTNDLPTNGTAVHWHGVRQLGLNEYDGVPGVTQCPIAPGQSMTYVINVTQFGTSWYHSHYSLQYGNGMFGPLTFNGPATANYDIDLGHVFLQDWSHRDVFEVYSTARLFGNGPPVGLDNGLVNGMNTFACSGSSDANCLGNGKKFQLIFTPGKKHLLRVLNNGITGVMQFSIDGHNLTVIANDFVPIVPYMTQAVQIAIGQRYDIIVEADAEPGDYWLRSGWSNTCDLNDNPGGITAIVRYDASSNAEPTSRSSVTTKNTCMDEPVASLVPHLALDVTNMQTLLPENLNNTDVNGFLLWTFDGSNLDLDWEHPTLQTVFAGESSFPTGSNVVKVKGEPSAWAVVVINNQSPFGNHPIHFHGHDFWVLEQSSQPFDGDTSSFNTHNPPRRDVATLPTSGHLAIAFQMDNPGVWLLHCHIVYHSSEGLALEILENMSEITQPCAADMAVFKDTCSVWSAYEPKDPDQKEDSGI